MGLVYNDDADRWYEVPDEEEEPLDDTDPLTEDLDEVLDKMMTDPKYYDNLVGWF